MDSWDQRREIENKIKNLLKEKFEDEYFSTLWLNKEYRKETDYSSHLEKFKYIFSLGEEGKIYLWNEISSQLDDVIEEDYTKEELSLIKEALSQKNKIQESEFSIYTNHNDPIETNRLLLVPYTQDLNNQYIDFLINNPYEYEHYYEVDYNKTIIQERCSQINNPLSFAILLKENKDYIGGIALNLGRNDAFYNLEYIIFPKYRHLGFAYEALNALLNKIKTLFIYTDTVKENFFEKEPCNIKCIEASTRESNYSSIKLLEKLGFAFDGKRPYMSKIKEDYFTHNLYHFIVK